MPSAFYEHRLVPSFVPRKTDLSGTETVLLAEDEPAVRSVAYLSLVWQGYKVLEAHNGVEALRVANQHAGPIQVLLTDVVMPEMGGRLLAETLRMDRQGIRVLFMSGYGDDEVVRRGTTASNVPFIHKPFSPNELAKRIRELIDRGR